MTKLMSKSELIQKVADQHSLPKKDVKSVIESLASVGYKELLPPSIEHWVPPAAGWTEHRLTRFNVDGLLPSLHGRTPLPR
ncbi:MAG: HU family DNA-binding protein [Xanthobacteraceae bacterium]